MSMSKAKKRRGAGRQEEVPGQRLGRHNPHGRRCCLQYTTATLMGTSTPNFCLLALVLKSTRTTVRRLLAQRSLTDLVAHLRVHPFEVTSYDPNLGVHSVLAVERESSLSSESIPVPLCLLILVSSKVKSPSSSRSSTNTLKFASCT